MYRRAEASKRSLTSHRTTVDPLPAPSNTEAHPCGNAPDATCALRTEGRSLYAAALDNRDLANSGIETYERSGWSVGPNAAER
jgi:hypothetical protein